MSIYKKMIQLMTPSEQKKIPLLILYNMIGMLLEILSIGSVVPVLALMTQSNFIEHYPIMQPLLRWLGSPNQMQLMIDSLFVLVVLYGFKSIFLMFMIWKQNKFIFDVQASLSYRLYKTYLEQPWSFHLLHNSAELIRNMTSEVNIYINSGLQAGFILVTECFVLFGVLLLLFWFKPFDTFIILFSVGFAGLLFNLCFKKLVLHLGESHQYYQGKRIQFIQQGLGGAKDVKLFGRESDFLAEFKPINEASTYALGRLQIIANIPRLWLELLAVVSLALLVWFLLKQGINLNGLMPILGLFAIASFRLLPSVNRILAAIQNIKFSVPVINNLLHEINHLTSDQKKQSNIPFVFKKELTASHVCYRYINSKKDALKNINLSIVPGSSVGFIGKSGAGKSTLVDVILGLLSPTMGTILVDGIDIQDNLRAWQDKIGYVPQSIFLTDDSLRRNIAFGLPNHLIHEEQIMKAIKLAQLDAFVEEQPDGLDTLVGERGVRLSGGQRQRIGIARALYHDPAILVLDEATSALDLATEKSVMDAIYALQGNKTLLIIAHRLSTVAHCDVLYTMEQGHLTVSKQFEGDGLRQ